MHLEKNRLFRLTSLMMILMGVMIMMTGCSRKDWSTVGKSAATPLTVVRDVVDAPVVSLANSFEYFADQSRIARAPTANTGWSLQGGFNVGIGYDFSYILFKGLSYTFGGIDYVVCRSLYPNWPEGITPWSKEGHHWGDLYFPNTRVLWGDDRPLQNDDHKHSNLVEKPKYVVAQQIRLRSHTDVCSLPASLCAPRLCDFQLRFCSRSIAVMNQVS